MPDSVHGVTVSERSGGLLGVSIDRRLSPALNAPAPAALVESERQDQGGGDVDAERAQAQVLARRRRHHGVFGHGASEPVGASWTPNSDNEHAPIASVGVPLMVRVR